MIGVFIKMYFFVFWMEVFIWFVVEFFFSFMDILILGDDDVDIFIIFDFVIFMFVISII